MKRGKSYDVSVRLYHQHALFEHICDFHIGFPIFELDDFSEQERASLAFCDELIVCSKWAKGIINEHFPDKVCNVVPLGVDPTIFYPSDIIEEEGGKEKPFTFFYPGKFEYRKGFDIVTQVFDRAFDNGENVQVVFLPQNLFIQDNEDWARSLLSSRLGRSGRVKVLGPLGTPQEVASLIRYSDAVVSFSRAEGWGLPLLEAISCGRQVVATDYSGHTEFLNSSCALLKKVGGRELAIDGVFFNGSGSWLSYFNSDIDDFVSMLRHTYQKGKFYNAPGVEQAKKFTWEEAAKKLVEVLS